MGAALFVTVVVSIPVGMLAALRQYSWSDKMITTFSTFAGDTVMMLERGKFLQAAGNVAAHNLLGIAAVAAGLALGRALA